MHVVLKADGWNNNVKWGKDQSDNCSVADSRQTQGMEGGDTGHKHVRWGDTGGDESVHAVFKAFHSFRDGKNIIYYSTKKKRDQNGTWDACIIGKNIYIFRNRKEIND